ncbi:hypothetical protein RFI_38522, partial [Reticulomyxa filosa]
IKDQMCRSLESAANVASNTINETLKSLDSMCIQSELQSTNTEQFMENAKQAVFEEFVAEQVWHWYEIKFKENHSGVPVVCFRNEGARLVQKRVLTLFQEFDQRLTILLSSHKAFANDMVCAIQQLPFFGSTLNATMNVNVNANDKPFMFGKTKTTPEVALDYWCGTKGTVKVNMDRTGRVCWYKVERNGKEEVQFFPVDHLERLLQQNKEQYSPHVISNTTK